MTQTANTPMLRQYQEIKSNYKDCILFYRLGDFYEMFFEDAHIASRILDLVLTSRGKGPNGNVPMCGIPYHAAETYIPKLIKAGQKIAICEQVEDPSLAKGIVRRDVVRVITAGTFIDESSNELRVILSVLFHKKGVSLAFTDATNGSISVKECETHEKAVEILAKHTIYECLYPARDSESVASLFDNPLLTIKNITMSPWDEWCYNYEIARKTLCDHFSVHNLRGFGVEDMPNAVSSAGALLEYLKQMNKQPLRHIDRVVVYTDTDYAFISPAACYGLEMSSLFQTLDKTECASGKRTFFHWLTNPLTNVTAIEQRQKAVTVLKNSQLPREALGPLLKRMPDIEKHLSRISCGYISPRDLLALRNALVLIPAICETLYPIADDNDLFNVVDLIELRTVLEHAINADMPFSKPEGRIVARGYHDELDSLRDIQHNGREWLKELQRKEIDKSGINSLKIGFNKIFGYYFEITKSNLQNVPDYFIRKQTLVNGERYITPELKEFEDKMLTAEEKINAIESKIVRDLAHIVLDNSASLHTLSESIGILDSLLSLSHLALLPGYICPHVSDDLCIDIKDGRHPVVESYAREPFIPNDILLDTSNNQLLIITGPNMSGKSTYIRQTAVLVIMAQMGSFIPASAAHIGIVDKIFTRIGAHDEISKGQSTFMVEMSETAGILNNLSERSLVILDEIGRGTSTFDGLSLAWAVSEYLQEKKVRTLFATHFHELIGLSDLFPGIRNYNVDVKEWNDEVIFLHKIVPGGTDDSYGIYVAKLAGIPKNVVKRAQKILHKLEIQTNLKDNIIGKKEIDPQLTFFSNPVETKSELSNPILDELKKIEINTMTPLEALQKISEWKESVIHNE
jgi:DNA mismatch repair protein MutS